MVANKHVHRAPRAGAKANKKEKARKKKKGVEKDPNYKNPHVRRAAALAPRRGPPPGSLRATRMCTCARQAFSVRSAARANKEIQRNLDRGHRKHHAPVHDPATVVPPPVVVVVMGPPGVGKSTLIKVRLCAAELGAGGGVGDAALRPWGWWVTDLFARAQCLVKKYTRHSLVDVRGPVTVVSGKNRRLTFYECPNNLSAMMVRAPAAAAPPPPLLTCAHARTLPPAWQDLAKIADLVLLMVDGSFGFEMETFEFLNIMQVHGFPKVMGVLTHLDKIKDNKALRKTKKQLKQRFWTETYQGAKLFYLSGLIHGKIGRAHV